MKRPSAGLTKKERSNVVKRAIRGKRISMGKTTFQDVEDKAFQTYGDHKVAKAIAAKVMWKGLAKRKQLAKAKTHGKK